MKNGLKEAAQKLGTDAGLSQNDLPPINGKQGYLYEWWSIFATTERALRTGQGPPEILRYLQPATRPTDSLSTPSSNESEMAVDHRSTSPRLTNAKIQGFESASRYGMTLCSSPTHITDIVGVDPTPVSATTRNSTSYTQSSSDSASSSVLAKRKCSPVGRDPATSRVQRQRLSPPAPEVLSQPVLGGAQDTYWLSNDSVHLGGYMYAGGGQDVDIGQRVVYPEAQYIGLEELYNIGIGSGHSCTSQKEALSSILGNSDCRTAIESTRYART
ncbi:hypothetical protein POSPLADRAFT_1045534 [Postia placenta MAD-698-R-SB12]|uniref:LisH domain-containing protein n=1 Tax=Postia placenta MAD-698-R-SB12 TaxID=670580 RepID=A0A1X6N7Y4_9APHY|nr:hypothetical protein POSPLADRAFT_1045534 [Postia placenta MAD-698-R-SB12]OSX64503.1 hypothetical protein POSPLADRAFT_1045534 [Postia placenta MAD-698-R-SB12]